MKMKPRVLLDWIFKTIDPAVQDKYLNLLKWFSANKHGAEHFMDLWQQEKRDAEQGILGAARRAEEMKRRYEGRFEEMRTACMMILQNPKSNEQIIKSCERMMNEVNTRLEIWESGDVPTMEGEEADDAKAL